LTATSLDPETFFAALVAPDAHVGVANPRAITPAMPKANAPILNVDLAILVSRIFFHRQTKKKMVASVF
jgi:hypothetical protein